MLCQTLPALETQLKKNEVDIKLHWFYEATKQLFHK
jgi:hypothetical protein